MSILALTLLCASGVEGAERPVTVQLGGGARMFSRKLALDDDFCSTLRLGLGLTDRITLCLDYVGSSPTRNTTSAIAHVNALRALARVDLLEGGLKPYVIAGAGGVLFNFSDATDTATGTLTAGLGISRGLGDRGVISMEGTADVYAYRSERFDVLGRPTYQSVRSYEPLGTISANLGFRF